MATLEQLMELQNLNECAWECTRQSRWKESTQRYLSDMLQKNLELREEILSGQYRVKPTIDFTLNERGHIRQIEAPVVRDRIVQKSLMKHVLTPSLTPYLIYDNYASMKQRGTSFARKRFEVMLHRYIRKYGTDGYILMIDVKKYFNNIDHDVLKRLIAQRLKDQPEDVMQLIHYVIDTSSKTGKGLNLGSECPQIFAIYYLNPVDQFVKVVKDVKYYGRYMDDIFAIGRSKAELRTLLTEIESKLAELLLEVNHQKTHIVKLRHGFTWLQIKYTVEPTGHITKAMSHNKIVRERRRLKAFRRQFDIGMMTEAQIWEAYQSWRGSVVRDHNACEHSIRAMDTLYTSLFPLHQEQPKCSRRALIIQTNRNINAEELYCLTH
jgi:hypothetical protein